MTEVFPDNPEPTETGVAEAPAASASGQQEERQSDFGGKTVGDIRAALPFMVAEGVNVYYGDNHAIQDVSLEIGKKEVIALIGPSGCG